MALDDVYDEFLGQAVSAPDAAREQRKNVTLRLPMSSHRKLGGICDVTGNTKTVVCEELLISAIDELYERLRNDERLFHYWAEREEQEEFERGIRADADYTTIGKLVERDANGVATPPRMTDDEARAAGLVEVK